MIKGKRGRRSLREDRARAGDNGRWFETKGQM